MERSSESKIKKSFSSLFKNKLEVPSEAKDDGGEMKADEWEEDEEESGEE